MNPLVKFQIQRVFEAGDCLRAGLKSNSSLLLVSRPVGDAQFIVALHQASALLG